MTIHIRTTCVPGLGHRSAQSLRDPRPSRHTTTGGHVTSFPYKEGGYSVPVLRCLEMKEMQRVGVQCSGSRFPSSVLRVSHHDGCAICVCRQGLYREAHSPPVTDTVHVTNNVVEVVFDSTSPGCYSHLFLEIPHFTMESAESIRRSLPRDAWVTSIDLVDTYFHIPIHRGYRKWLRNQTRDTIYQFRALPFGLSPAP